MKRLFTLFPILLLFVSFTFARTFDGTEKLYFNAAAVSWWTNDQAVQRAVLDNSSTVIGVVECGAVYAFTIPAGDYTTIRFERAASAGGAAWNKTGNITIDSVMNYISAFTESSTTAVWEALTAPQDFHIYVTNETGWDTFLLYEWGTPDGVFGTWPGTTSNDYTFRAVPGNTVVMHLLFHNNVGEGLEGDKRIRMDISEARDYHIIVSDSYAGEDSKIKVLSINNSLIDYNDQYAMFNNMCKEMGKDATWTKHTNLGKTLAYHYYEDPLTPDAKTVVSSVAWSYIILQEQSGLPRTDLSTFYSNVETWVTYIRTNCPNPDAQIIMPINWAYSNDADFQNNNATLIANYKAVADDFNITLCPVAIAYGNYRLDHPAAFAADLYSDDRHPTQAATYLACCLEYATMFGEDPLTITWQPGGLSAGMAERMRSYAQEAYEGIERTEPASQPSTEALSITGATMHTEDFNTIGGVDITPAPASDGKTAVEKPSLLPTGWRIEKNTSAARTIGFFSGADSTTTYIGGTSLASNDKNGTWNFGATGSSDRAVGGITSSISGGARTINIMVHMHNDANMNFNALGLSYDIEKYRNGANPAGFTVQLYSSTDGETWTEAGNDFRTTFNKDDNTDGAAVVPMTTTSVNARLDCNFPQDSDLYLAWSISVSTGSDLAKSMALALDNICITPFAADGLVYTTDNEQHCRKILRNGQLLILQTGNIYTLTGQQL